MIELKDRVVLITGGSSGIGFEIAKKMLEQGSKVIICGRSQEKISPEVVAAEALNQLNKGKDEIYVKMSRMLFFMSRLAPKRGVKMINGFIPPQAEELFSKR